MYAATANGARVHQIVDTWPTDFQLGNHEALVSFRWAEPVHDYPDGLRMRERGREVLEPACGLQPFVLMAINAPNQSRLAGVDTPALV